jgi:hypothetical protein
MVLELYKITEAINTPVLEWDVNGNAIKFGTPFPVKLWKFKDENGNLWNTETSIDGTEEEAKNLILQA